MSLYQTFKKMQTGPVMIGIAVFGLVTFTITSAVLQTFAHDGRGGGATTITLPSGKVHNLDADRGIVGRAHSLFFETNAQQPYPRFQQHAFQFGDRSKIQQLLSELEKVRSWTQRLNLDHSGMTKKEREERNDEITQIMLVNALARDQGIEVGVAEMQSFVEGIFPSAEIYKGYCDRVVQSGIPAFEAALREALLFRRAMDLALAQTPLPTGDELVKEWCDRNERFNFEIAAFPVDVQRKQIEGEKDKITNDDLKKWLDGMKEDAKSQYKDPEKFVLEGAAVLDPAAPLNPEFQKLVDAVTLETSDAQAYFDLSKTERFKKPATASKPATTSAPASIPIPEFYTFEEMKPRVEKEVKIARALDKVREEAVKAMNEKDFDLKKIADKYGLLYWTSGAPASETAVIETPVHGTQSWRAPLETAKEGEFLPGSQASAAAIEITRVKQRVAPRIPEISDIRDKVLANYIDQKADEKAKAQAQSFKDAVNDAKGDDRFIRVSKEKGMETKTSGFISKSMRDEVGFNNNPDSKDPVHFLASQRTDGLPPSQALLRDPFALKKDVVGGPYSDAMNKIYYVVRCADRKEATKAEILPIDYLKSRDNLMRELRERKCYDLMSSVALAKALKMEVPKREKKDAN